MNNERQFQDLLMTYQARIRARLRSLIGEKRMRLINGASHNVFIDQQAAFFDALRQFQNF